MFNKLETLLQSKNEIKTPKKSNHIIVNEWDEISPMQTKLNDDNTSQDNLKTRLIYKIIQIFKCFGK